MKQCLSRKVKRFFHSRVSNVRDVCHLTKTQNFDSRHQKCKPCDLYGLILINLASIVGEMVAVSTSSLKVYISSYIFASLPKDSVTCVTFFSVTCVTSSFTKFKHQILERNLNIFILLVFHTLVQS